MASPTTAEISLRDLKNDSTSSATITNVKHLTSYNWIEASTPTIAVPGSPALWAPPALSRQLLQDTGLIHIAQNAFRNPNSPLEPLFQALRTANPSFDLNSIDVVTDRNNMRKLLSFVDPTSNPYGVDPFAMAIEVVNNTAIFSRQETKTYEILGPNDFRGFGHEFEKAYTKEQVHGSTGHHRIVTYDFGGMKFILRHETDGYVASKSGDDLAEALESLSVSATTGASTKPIAGSKMTIRKEGKMTPLESTLEIKTRVFHKPLDINSVAPQLWLSQTPKLVRAYHRRGLFENPKVEDVTAAIKAWEKENSKHLAKLAALVRKIIAVAKDLGGAVMLRYGGVGEKLVLTRVSGQKKMLPEGMDSYWDVKKVESRDILADKEEKKKAKK
ncbi:hypothetical protein F5X68DRAFT_269775 [Plectosphaerella plurivora]|uniref:Geranylgeranyl pyrophosphate synthetase n=1 Tax=Plectosphaerella plurivora TaxID=936078 RepID=A0A9P8V7C9_9PEZI|nr:hypothetical protein F5X68DRAFT_269775 [Plectosphaerella plurivora]